MPLYGPQSSKAPPSGPYRVGVIGTSLIQQNNAGTASKISNWSKGWLSWARAYAAGLWECPVWQDPTVRIGWEPSGTAGATRYFYGANGGVSGQTLDQILPRIPTLTSQITVDLWIFDGGTNDMSSMTKENIHAKRVQAIELLAGTGVPVLVLPILARGVGSWASGSAERAKANWINRQTLEYVNKKPNMLVLDWNRYWIDATSADGAPFTGYSPDDIHFQPPGAQAVGKYVSDWLKNYFRGLAPSMAVSNGDVFDAVNNPRGNLFTNAFCLGTTGVVGTGVTGTAGTGLRIERATTPAGDATAVASKEVRTDNRGEWQVLTMTPGTLDSIFYIRTNAADTAHTILAGSWVRFFVRIRLPGYAGLRSVNAYLRDNGTGGITSYDMEPYTNDSSVLVNWPAAAVGELLLQTPAIQLVADSAALRCRVEAYIASTTNGASGTCAVAVGEYWFGQCENPQALIGYTGG